MKYVLLPILLLTLAGCSDIRTKDQIDTLIQDCTNKNGIPEIREFPFGGVNVYCTFNNLKYYYSVTDKTWEFLTKAR